MLKKPGEIFSLSLLNTNKASLKNGLKNIRWVHRECDDDPGPRCAKMTYPPKKPEDDCTLKQRISELRKPKLSYVSIWEDPECCRKYTCPNHQVRYDDLYWKPTNKYTRNYMRTWAECPEFKIVPIECKNPEIDVCPPEKRPRKPRPKLCGARDIGLMKCKMNQDNRCPKVKSPKCAHVARSLRCKVYRSLSDCKKLCTPYPSFSECNKDDPSKKRPVECNCLLFPMQCEIQAEQLKLEKWEKEHPKQKS